MQPKNLQQVPIQVREAFNKVAKTTSRAEIDTAIALMRDFVKANPEVTPARAAEDVANLERLAPDEVGFDLDNDDDDPEATLGSAFCTLALERGVYLHPKHNMFLSVVHRPADIGRALEATDQAFAALATRYG